MLELLEEITVAYLVSTTGLLFTSSSSPTNTKQKEIFQDQSEEKVLWTIEGQLDKISVEPFMKDYKEIIEESRKRLRD